MEEDNQKIKIQPSNNDIAAGAAISKYSQSILEQKSSSTDAEDDDDGIISNHTKNNKKVSKETRTIGKQNNSSTITPIIGKTIVIVNQENENNIEKLTSVSSEIRHRKGVIDNKDSNNTNNNTHYQTQPPHPSHNTVQCQQEYYRQQQQQQDEYNEAPINNVNVNEQSCITQIYNILRTRFPTTSVMTIELLSTFDAIDSGDGIVWIPSNHFFIDTLTSSWQYKWRKRGVTLSNNSTDCVLYGCEPEKYYSLVTMVWQKFIDYGLIVYYEQMDK